MEREEEMRGDEGGKTVASAVIIQTIRYARGARGGGGAAAAAGDMQQQQQQQQQRQQEVQQMMQTCLRLLIQQQQQLLQQQQQQLLQQQQQQQVAAAAVDLRRIGLAERRHGFGLVQSHPKNNSQTIHCGDIETNYTLEKAKIVKRQADMLRNFATKLPPEVRDR
ncbi:malate:quinone oxidoreductase, putative [Eimeria maxima]|uniref:Malate:quinone oxidoreductase, putative n=1 Tax=Eimeria maxima TaxID=5804 RepID=U6M4C3_EIMMA|nr:malate:quinone oxidoreductase, putative [Eimeria maxima]CDJ59042.1 malate:quinone oxidoreductase, putative [Eimeria maxima]